MSTTDIWCFMALIERFALVLREREGKAGGGKGPLMSDKSFTLSTSNFQTLFIFKATRVDDVRLYFNYSPTVATYWGTGGARVPYVFPIDDGREVEKYQNGTGIGADGDPAYTLDRQQIPAVAFHTTQTPISGEVAPALGTTSQGMGVIAPTLSASNNPSRSPQSSEVTAQIEAMVKANSVVRRLTPTECERLQGFPDGWTEAQADSHRYKQLGNAVAVPVVKWVINRLI